MSKERSKKQESSRRRHNFLIETFFEGVPGYGEKVVNNWVLVKHLNGNSGDYEVNIYTKEAFEKYKYFIDNKPLFSKPSIEG